MAEDATYVKPGEEFKRDTNYIPTRITADGRDGYPVEPARYRLIAARACPWANRAVIVRRLLGLEPAISMGIAGPLHDERSWRFHLDPGDRDPACEGFLPGLWVLRERQTFLHRRRRQQTRPDHLLLSPFCRPRPIPLIHPRHHRHYLRGGIATGEPGPALNFDAAQIPAQALPLRHPHHPLH